MQQRNYSNSTIFRQREYPPHFMRDRILQKKIFKNHLPTTNGAKWWINFTLLFLSPPLLKSKTRNIISRQQRLLNLISKFPVITQLASLKQQYTPKRISPMTLRIVQIIIIKAGKESLKTTSKLRIINFKMQSKGVIINLFRAMKQRTRGQARSAYTIMKFSTSSSSSCKVNQPRTLKEVGYYY